jgi:TRAP-type transport system periplasmic protein
MKRVIALLAVIVLMVSTGVGVLGCGSDTETTEVSAETTQTTTDANEKITLTYVAMGEAQGYNKRAQDAFLNWLDVESGGRLTIEFTSGTVVPMGEEWTGISNGLADMGAPDSGFLTGLVPANEVTTLPWLSGWPGALQATLAHMDLYEQFPELQAELEGFKVLWFHSAAPTQIQTTSKPIHTAADLEGLSQSEIGPVPAETIKALGAVPASFPPVEVYDALSKGVADGVSVNWDACRTFGYFDVIKYSTQASVCVPTFCPVIMNQDVWDGLPNDLKEIFSEENCRKMATIFGYAYDRYDMESRDMMSEKFKEAGLPEIYVLPDSEREQWKAATAGVTQNWIDTVTASGLPGQEIYDAAVKAFEKYAWSDELAAEAEAIVVEWENAGK